MENNYYKEIKDLLINNEVYKKVKDYSKNKSDLNTYYNVGKILIEAQGGEERAKYGNKLIKEYTKKLEIDIGKKYSGRTLRRMRQFYLLFKNWSAMPTELTISHYTELLSLKDFDEINYYINISINHRLGYRELHDKIKNKEYERLPKETKEKLINKEKLEMIELVPNPIAIKNKNNIDINNIREKYLKELILDDISSFMKELGNGFSFIDSEYKIKIGDRSNYIDLLLFNYVYNSFVVVELKVTELKKEHIGQIEVYMNYIDKNIKNINQDKTIGLIICKKNNNFVLGYSSDLRIFSREYILN